MKKKIITACLVIMLLTVSFMAGFSVTKSQAVVPLGFGSILLDWFPCDCSGSLWLYYSGLPNSPFLGGALGYGPHDTITYSYYNVTTPGVWHLGLYSPGVQSCWLFVVEGCIILPVVGHELMVGTSLTPAEDNTGANDLSPETLKAEGWNVNNLNDACLQIPGVNVM